MKLIVILLIQILILVGVSFCALIDGDMFWSCFAGLYAVPHAFMLINFAPDLMRGGQ